MGFLITDHGSHFQGQPGFVSLSDLSQRAWRQLDNAALIHTPSCAPLDFLQAARADSLNDTQVCDDNGEKPLISANCRLWRWKSDIGWETRQHELCQKQQLRVQFSVMRVQTWTVMWRVRDHAIKTRPSAAHKSRVFTQVCTYWTECGQIIYIYINIYLNTCIYKYLFKYICVFIYTSRYF